MSSKINVRENGLHVEFDVRDNGVVELTDFSPVEIAGDRGERLSLKEDVYHPLLEVQITGKSTDNMHGYKHNFSSASLDFRYVTHQMEEKDKTKELVIVLRTDYAMEAVYHMKFFKGIPVVQVWVELKNQSQEEIGLEYVSSFVYRSVSGNGVLPYFEKTDIYTPYNSW